MRRGTLGSTRPGTGSGTSYLISYLTEIVSRLCGAAHRTMLRLAAETCTAEPGHERNHAAAATFTADSASWVRLSSVFFSSCRVASSRGTASLIPSCWAHCFSVP